MLGLFKLGTMWAYYPASEVAFEGAPRAYARADRDDPTLHFNFCADCGATTHWSYVDPNGPDRMGVNMQLFEPGDLVGIEVRYGDRRNHDMIEPRRTYREPTTFDGLGAKP